MTTQHIGRFSDLGIKSNFLAALTQKGFLTPTPIQHQVIPGALEGKDVIGIAQTGTGKTLAFGIPMIQQIGSGKGKGLILVPTRELALQVEQELLKIAGPLGLKTVVLIGGTPQARQVKALKAKPHLVIATPGRLVDLMDQGHLSLGQVGVIALDEADRMLDVGFLPQIKKIFSVLPKERQTLLFSATMPKEISSLAAQYMHLPLRIEIAPQGTTAKLVEQELFIVGKQEKLQLLSHTLSTYKNDTILLFSRTKHGAKRLARDIRGMGHTADEIHSNRTQAQRQRALDGFRKGKIRILVATDIAARGIDVKEVSVVINYDLPDNAEDYVHRIGRTGRAGRAGTAISFATPGQKADIKKIERLIRKALPVLALPKALPQVTLTRTQPDRQQHGRRHGDTAGMARGGARRQRSHGARNESRDHRKQYSSDTRQGQKKYPYDRNRSAERSHRHESSRRSSDGSRSSYENRRSTRRPNAGSQPFRTSSQRRRKTT